MGPRTLVMLLLLALAGCVVSQPTGPTGPTSTAPGWTGRTTVIGNNSTIAGDAASTYDQQKWQRERH